MIGINLFVLKFLLFLFIVVWLFRAPHTMPYNQAQGAPARIEQRETTPIPDKVPPITSGGNGMRKYCASVPQPPPFCAGYLPFKQEAPK